MTPSLALPIAIRHIQDHNEANTTEITHWGYPSRIYPCTSGEGTCEYLDAVYWMHDTSMLYTFIMWGVILGVLVLWMLARGWRMGGPAQRVGGAVDAVMDGVGRTMRRRLLPDVSGPLRRVFGRVTRLQVSVLAIMLGYLLVFSQVGIVYRTWITPVKGTNLHNTRTGLGGWSDRIGALAYALTPFTILLGSRESILSILTGIPYQHFNFLHRWLGRVIFVQSFLHTLGWTIVEGKFYQPQPSTYAEFMAQQYIIFGVIAMFFVTFLMVFSTRRMISWTGYEFFKWTHLLVALLYVGACWGHWNRLQCWMIPSLALILLDQAVRYLRMLALHFRGNKGFGIGFRCADAQVNVLGKGEDTVIRIDFDYEHTAWKAGQHFFLCFPALSIWQCHPFTPSSLPDPNSKFQHHTYLIRMRKGQTSKLACLAAQPSTPVLLTGAYGNGFPSFEAQNVLAVAGGTGVTFTLPIVLAALKQQWVLPVAVDFVWIVRYAQDLKWLGNELATLKDTVKGTPSLRVSLFVTRETATHVKDTEEKQMAAAGIKTFTTVAVPELENDDDLDEGINILRNMPGVSIQYLGNRHPGMSEVVDAFVDRQSIIGGSMEIVGSGPEAMGSDLRSAVARVDETQGMSFYWDSRE